MPSKRRNLLGAAGQAGSALDVSEVFSIDTWTGTGAAQTITNGIDLAGEGGIVIIKEDANTDWHVFDTESGVNNYWHLNTNDDLISDSNTITSFNSDGFTLGSDADVNQLGQTFYAWTFRQAPNFFEIATISHTNGADSTHTFSTLTTASMIMCKRVGTGAAPPNGQVLSSEFASDALSLDLTDTNLVADQNEYERNGTDGVRLLSALRTADYVTYCWDTALDIIDIGTYTGDGTTTGNDIDIGFDLQYIMIKAYSGTSAAWEILDTTRGIGSSVGDDARLEWNGTGGLSTNREMLDLITDGFTPTETSRTNANSAGYFYMAIKAE